MSRSRVTRAFTTCLGISKTECFSEGRIVVRSINYGVPEMIEIKTIQGYMKWIDVLRLSRCENWLFRLSMKSIHLLTYLRQTEIVFSPNDLEFNIEAFNISLCMKRPKL
jgi:hypothetical protein